MHQCFMIGGTRDGQHLAVSLNASVLAFTDETYRLVHSDGPVRHYLIV